MTKYRNKVKNPGNSISLKNFRLFIQTNISHSF